MSTVSTRSTEAEILGGTGCTYPEYRTPNTVSTTVTYRQYSKYFRHFRRKVLCFIVLTTGNWEHLDEVGFRLYEQACWKGCHETVRGGHCERNILGCSYFMRNTPKLSLTTSSALLPAMISYTTWYCCGATISHMTGYCCCAMISYLCPGTAVVR